MPYWPDGAHKQVVFREAAEPAETGDELVIPTTMRWVIVMGMRMDHEMIARTPTPGGLRGDRDHLQPHGGSGVSAGRVRSRGRATGPFPVINDLGFEHSAGYRGRLRRAGSSRQADHPRVRAQPSALQGDHRSAAGPRLSRSSFGVGAFCETCRKCARSCPSRSIPQGPRTWSGPNISNNPGVFTWHLDNETCRKYWNLALGDNCTVCVRVCPFTKGPALIHDVARAAVAGLPVLHPLLLRLDDALGYGREKNAASFWSA